jgi:HD-GYP domain-containing protein (c-di-GMP phosphodiesterase class II)
MVIGNRPSQDMIGSLVQVVNNMVNLHDPTAAGHQTEVALLGRAIAEEMKQSQSVVECVFLAGQIHDIGKICIPYELLSFPGKLSHSQHMTVMLHPQASYEILKPIDFPWPVADSVLQHHERLDGSGYPNGITGDQMRFESKILAVADVVQAMLTERPYHPPFTIVDVLEELETHKGVLYDASVVETYGKLVAHGGHRSHN